MNKTVYKTLKGICKNNSRKDKLFNINDCKKSFKTVLRKTGIDDFRFHDLRHTFASYLAMSGANLRAIQTLMGHKDIDTTLRYTHLCDSYLEKTVENLYEKGSKYQ